MSRLLRPTRASGTRCAPRLEPLEPRRLFAVSIGANLDTPTGLSRAAVTAPGSTTDLTTLSVIATDPADGAMLNQSPSALNITFNQPFDVISVGFQDFALQKVDANGNVLEDDSGMLSEPFDLTGTPSTLPVTINGVLAPGRYQIVLLGSMSMLSGVGQNGNPGVPLDTAGVDQVLSTFTVSPAGSALSPAPTLGTATNLGTLGPQATETTGSLDLQANLGDYQLYQFTLAPGHFWRIGAEVYAQRDNGTLNSALALFDSQGHMIKVDDVGRSDAPSDPFLFAGLQPGTYYIGVSGSGDLPGYSGGYDPVNGVYGTSGLAQASGPYRLRLLADAEDSPTQLQSATLQYADPLDSRPTGITLVFSGPMDIGSFVQSVQNGAFEGLKVVDQHGTVWPLTPIAYNEANSEFTFLFSQPLPSGHYKLVLPDTGGVTDLAGLPPVAHGNSKTGDPMLTSWTVSHAYAPNIPNNLGTVINGLGATPPTTTQIQPGSTVTYRFVAPAAGEYDFLALVAGGALKIQAIGPNGQITQETNASNGTMTGFMHLECGIYYLQLTATGSAPVDVAFAVYRPSEAAEAVFENGVGQGPALNLILIAPTTPTSSPILPWASYASSPIGPSASNASVESTDSNATATVNPSPSTGTGATAATVTSFSGSMTGSAGLVLTLGSSLVGSPLAGAEQVGAVGPGTFSGATALALNSPGVLQGITYGQSLGANANGFSGSSDEADPSPAVAGDAPIYPTDGALVVNGPEPAPPMDREVLATGGWLGEIGAVVLQWFGSRPPTRTGTVVAEAGPEAETEAEAAQVERIAMSRDDSPGQEEQEHEVEHADLATPLGLSVISVLALRLQQPARRWVNRRRRRTLGQPGSPATGRGPHARV